MYPTNGHSTVAEREGRPAVYDAPSGPGADGVRERPDERPVGELFQDLANDTRTLASLELELFRTERLEKISAAGKDAGFIAAGGFIAYAGFVMFLAFIGFGLASFIPLWLSFLIVGVVVMAVGYLLIRKGLNDFKSRSMAPQKTIASLKHDKEWLQRERAK